MKYRHGFLAAVTVFGMAAAGATAQEAPFTIVQVCDTQLGMGGYEHDVATFKLAVAQINALKPDLVLFCGDLVNKGGEDQQIQDFLAIRSSLTMPSYCTPGNHDIGNDASDALLQIYRDRIGEDHYAFDHKGYTFVCVNTQLWKTPVEGKTAAQDAWFETTLAEASSAGRPVIVFGHIPLFLDKPDEPEEYFNIPPEKRHALMALFKKHGVAAVLMGHTHENIVREHDGIVYVASATTSKNFDKAPMGFRVWHIGPGKAVQHEYVAIEGAEPPAETK